MSNFQLIKSAPASKFEEMVGDSPQISKVISLAHRVAMSKVNVLISGESGTGKELVARSIHYSSNRAAQPFVAVNCAAIPEALLESELFGHAKGSFTGAVNSRKGLFQEANGGTIFLDEIGDLSLPLQAKLLRVLQDQKIRCVGDNTERQLNIRIVTATHRDLKKAVHKELFREDLYYRLNVIEIVIPPLRDRKQDISTLAEHFVAKYCRIHKLRHKTIAPQAMEYLQKHNWPGNIRQLENSIERVLVMIESEIVTIDDFFFLKEDGSRFVATEDEFRVSGEIDLPSLNELTLRYITYILGKTGGKKEKAAKILKIDRTTLHRKMSEYHIPGTGLEQPGFGFAEA